MGGPIAPFDGTAMTMGRPRPVRFTPSLALQYEQSLLALTRDGRSVGAARRWLERHPDWVPGQPGPRAYRRA